MRIKNLPSIESMDGSQDALIIEQTDGSEDKSRKVSPEQIKQYVLGNSIDDIYSVMGQNGAKNLIPYPYDYSSRPSLAGINYTINADGSITMNGTTTGRTNYWLYDHGKGFMGLKSGDYILSKTGRSNVGFIVAFYKGSTWVKQVTATENDMTVSIDVNSNEYDNIGIAVSFGNAGITVENVTVYPMLRLASDTDNTYQPYAKTNKQLTETIGDLTATGVTGASAAAQIGALNTTIGDLSQTGLTGDSVAEQLDVARGQIATIHPNDTTLQSYNFLGGNLRLNGPDDKPIKIYETGDEDYKAICIYDKNNVERYQLLFSGGHFRFTSKDANNNIIVNQLIV